MFERVAVWSLNRGAPRQQALNLSRNEVQSLVRAVTDLAHEKIGALIVIRGKDAIVRHINGGWDLNGELTEPVLKSLFDPHSMGHDGALIVDGNRILQFGCHLPLSKDLKKIPAGGTRHAAALGLAELTDALCIVVSEERGTISIAVDGEIEVIEQPERLNLILQRFYEETHPAGHQQSPFELLTRNPREKVIAVLVTLGLWFFYVHEGQLTYRSYRVPVEYTNLPRQLEVQEIIPPTVEAAFSGPRRYFYFMNSNPRQTHREFGERARRIRDQNDSEIQPHLFRQADAGNGHARESEIHSRDKGRREALIFRQSYIKEIAMANKLVSRPARKKNAAVTPVDVKPASTLPAEIIIDYPKEEELLQAGHYAIRLSGTPASKCSCR